MLMTDKAHSKTCHLVQPHELYPTPQLTTMTIARGRSMTHGAPLPRVPMMRTTSGDMNPMMRVTLPKELGDDPLASPIGGHTLPAFFNEPEQKKEPEPEPEPVPAPTGFFTRRRQASIEKKPPMAPMLRRTTSAPIKKDSLLSKMAPMLKRVVSGSKKTDFPEDEEDDMDQETRESLLMLMRVPEIQRVSLIPLMMAGHSEY